MPWGRRLFLDSVHWQITYFLNQPNGFSHNIHIISSAVFCVDFENQDFLCCAFCSHGKTSSIPARSSRYYYCYHSKGALLCALTWRQKMQKYSFSFVCIKRAILIIIYDILSMKAKFWCYDHKFWVHRIYLSFLFINTNNSDNN